MSKTLRTAALVVGGVALVATGIGAAAGLGAFGAAAAMSAGTAAFIATAATVATVAGFAAAALTAASVFTARKPGVTISGSQTTFTASLDQGIPWVIGQTATAGCAVHDITFDTAGSTKNTYQTFFGIWSGDRIKGVVKTTMDGVEETFSGDVASGGHAGWMWHRYQVGLSPEPAALLATGFFPYPAGWSATAKLSGNAAFSWTLKFDEKGNAYPGGVVPKKLDELQGAYAWDPRLDSTFPGGAGPQRADDESTWAYTENPFLIGLRWARGIWQNGKRVMGIGMALTAIDVPSAVYAANVADENNWKVGGVVYSTDPKWDVLKKICAAASGEPIRVGGKLHFLVDCPRVSLATITNDDIIGKCNVPGGARMKDRINGIIPKYRSRDHDWQLVDAAKVSVDAYVTFDGRPKTRALPWELVQDAHQVAELATYEICNRREIDGITMPLKLKWIGYKPGDAVTVAASVVAMDNQLIVLRKRNLDPATGAVTFTARTETTEKHAFALGKTTTPPPTPALQTVDRSGLLQPGISAAWPAVTDPEGTKPEDNATNSADPNSPFGPDGTVKVYIDDLARVNADLSITVPSIFDLTKLVQTSNAIMQAKTTLDGKQIGTVVVDVRTVTQDTVETLHLVGVKNGPGNAFIMNLETVQVANGVSLAQKFEQITAHTDTAVGGVTTSLNAAVTSLSQAITSGDSALAQTIDQVEASVDAVSAQVTFLKSATVDVSGNVVAKAVLALKANGRLAGLIATNNGQISQLDLDFDVVRIFKPDGQLLFQASGNVVYMPNVVVDTLQVNTAMVPARASATSYIGGSYGSSTGVATPRSAVLTASIYMPVPGWIEAIAKFQQGFTAAGPWSATISVNGSEQADGNVGGTGPQDAVATQSFFRATSAGTYTVSLVWAGYTGIELRERTLAVKGFPATA